MGLIYDTTNRSYLREAVVLCRGMKVPFGKDCIPREVRARRGIEGRYVPLE